MRNISNSNQLNPMTLENLNISLIGKICAELPILSLTPLSSSYASRKEPIPKQSCTEFFMIQSKKLPARRNASHKSFGMPWAISRLAFCFDILHCLPTFHFRCPSSYRSFLRRRCSGQRESPGNSKLVKCLKNTKAGWMLRFSLRKHPT